MLARTVTLPIEAGGALRQTLGILDDHMQAEDPYRAASLDQRLVQMWSDEEWQQMKGPERGIELEIEDAALILQGLAFTEMMSVELPWFDMVQWTVDFISAELRPAWTEEEWTSVASTNAASPFGQNPYGGWS